VESKRYKKLVTKHGPVAQTTPIKTDHITQYNVSTQISTSVRIIRHNNCLHVKILENIAY